MDGAGAAGVAGDEAPVVIQLAEVERQVDAEVHHHLPGCDAVAGDDIGEISVEVAVAHLRKRPIHLAGGFLDECEQLGTGDVPPGEFGVPVAHVPAPADSSPDVVTQVAAAVQHQIAAAVGDPRRLPPGTGIVGIEFDGSRQGGELPKNHSAHGGGQLDAHSTSWESTERATVSSLRRTASRISTSQSSAGSMPPALSRSTFAGMSCAARTARAI